jgi:aminoglycoside phosphotransferase (APT) family kinase protein
VLADLQPGIEAFLLRRTAARVVRVSSLRRLTGGASRETWAFDATLEHADGRTETLPLILQRDTRGAPKTMSRADEFHLMQAAHAAGVPAPEPVLMGDDSLDGEFFLVRREDGETLPRKLLRDDSWASTRDLLTPQLGAIAAKIHGIPLDAVAFMPAPPPGADPALHELERFEQVFRAIAPEPHPAFELAFRWLRQRQQRATGGQQARPRALVHGDYRMGNVLFGPEGVRLILDWELAHIGDAMEDLGWLCVRSWRFGGDQPVGGIGAREELFAAYEAAGGAAVDPERVRWWEVFGNLRWGIICISQAKTYLDGVSNSVELASIGRRTAETEWELLELMSAGSQARAQE